MRSHNEEAGTRKYDEQHGEGRCNYQHQYAATKAAQEEKPEEIIDPGAETERRQRFLNVR